jgi:NAD(P)-dependent dehydrogenase (short-subunit alcohol dehydrogenase family)
MTMAAGAETLLEQTLQLAAGAPLLADRPVILTGATGGIGRTVARVLAAAGAQLVVADLSIDAVAALESELQNDGRQVFGRALDASDFGAFATLVEEVEQEIGPVEGLVNCAGLWEPMAYEEVDEAAWQRSVTANLATAFAGCRAVLPRMAGRGQGSVVNFASTAGEYGSISPAAHYAAAKGGVVAMTKSLAREVGPAGVRVNALSPGPIDTVALGAVTPEQKAKVGSRTLLNRLGRPDEIAAGCLFLLSPLSTFVTGHVLRVNGGALL